MKTQTSKTRIWLSSLVLLPTIAILFYSFAEKEYVEKESIAKISQQSDENTESNLFLVTVEKNGNSIELKCENGCKWSHLILEPSSEPYIINDYGFSEGNTVESDKFTFSIKPNKSGVDLNGLKGTAWIDLSFSLKENQRQAINQLGMSNLPTKDLKETEKYIGKKLEIRAIKDKLTINKKPSSPKTYMNDLNDVTKDWTDKDYKSTTPELEIVECSKDFLDQLDSNFRKTDYFLIAIQGSKQLNNNRPTPEIKQEKPIMVILINRKGELLVDDELGSMESIASQLKTLKKSAKASDAVFVRYDPSDASNTVLKEVIVLIRTYDFKVIQADASQKNPPPPPPNKKKTKGGPNANSVTPQQKAEIQKDPKLKTGFIDVNGEKLYYTIIDNETTYYNRFGVKTDKNGIEITHGKQVNANNVWSDSKITKVYQNGQVVSEFNDTDDENSNTSPSFLEFISDMDKKGATFYYQDKKISAKQAQSLAKNNKGKNHDMITKLDDNGKYIVRLSYNTNDLPSALQNKGEKSYKLSLVDKSPVYSGCSDSASEFKIRTCLSESFTNHFEKNLNTEIIRKIKPNVKRKLALIMFNIDKNGNLSSVRHFPKNEELKKELDRVLKLIPKLKPGMRKGKEVNTSYSIAINFEKDEIVIKGKSGPY